MIQRLVDKKPTETIKGLWLDFKNLLLTGETISTATVTGSVAGIVQNMQIMGTKITWDATGGTDGADVVFTVHITGSLGSIREGQSVMAIKS